MNYGLSTLMESMAQSDTAINQNDQLFGLFESTIDDRVASMVTGENYDLSEDNEDSVDRDLAGQGIGYEDEKKLEKIIATIPEDESDSEDFDEEEIENVMESVLVGV